MSAGNPFPVAEDICGGPVPSSHGVGGLVLPWASTAALFQAMHTRHGWPAAVRAWAHDPGDISVSQFQEVGFGGCFHAGEVDS